MNIKIFMGSIGFVVILILVSFTSVVNVQSTPSGYVTDSPLFNTRVNRATNNENNKILTSDYLGKGLHIIQFPLRDNTTIMIQKFLKRIRTMDDAAFNTFITMVLHLIHKEPQFRNVNTEELLTVLYQLKNNQDILSYKDSDFDNNVNRTDFTLGPFTPAGGCDIWFWIWFSLVTLVIFIDVILTIFFRNICTAPSFVPMTC
jgi:hypothetical protein